MEHNFSNAYDNEDSNDLPDLRPRQNQIQVPLNRPIDHWTTTTESVTEELMSPSDVDNAAQLFDNPDIEELTDPTEANQDIDTENELGNQDIDITPPVQVETIETDADDELIENNRPETPQYQYHTYSILNVSARLRLPFNDSIIEFCRRYNNHIIEIEN